MPNPKRQHSKQRGRKRRTHWKAKVSSLNPCSHCGKMIASHRVCPHCGHYKNKPVVAVKVRKEKEDKGKAS